MTPVRNRNRLRSAAKIVVFDIAGPLVAYSLLRSGERLAAAAQADAERGAAPSDHVEALAHRSGAPAEHPILKPAGIAGAIR